MVNMEDRKRTAIHEAGHAVIARTLGIECGEVTIVGEEGHSVGHSVFSDPRFHWQRGEGPRAKAADSFAIALFAGAEAERHLLGDVTTGDDVDRERATACLAWASAVKGASFVGDGHFDRHEAKLRRRAAELVCRHRPQIERVANSLIERGALAGYEVDALLALNEI